jgi:hypothetical protein
VFIGALRRLGNVRSAKALRQVESYLLEGCPTGVGKRLVNGIIAEVDFGARTFSGLLTGVVRFLRHPNSALEHASSVFLGEAVPLTQFQHQ